MNLAIFDLDDTLLPGDSESAWFEFLITRGIVDREETERAGARFGRQYREGGLDIFEYMEFSLQPLSRHSKEQLDDWHREFMAEMIEPIRLDKADDLLGRHRAQGDFLLIVTASNRFVAEPIARALGVDDLLATEPEIVDGRYTGRVTGTPCFRDGKVERLDGWLAERQLSLEDSSFFSDSHNDLPLLERVTYPVAVDPDARLRATAAERGWPVISLRDK